MKKFFVLLGVLLITGLTAAGLVTSATAKAATVPEHIISTLYAYPTESSWQTVEKSAPAVNAAIVDICAPDGTGSGCNGKPADEKATVWVPALDALRSAKIQALYYISTNYGAVPLATVEAEMNQAKTWYGAASPMFDTVSTSDPSYYKALYAYAVKIGAAKVMFNPGTVAPQSYMFGPKEVLQQFEGTQAQFQAAKFPSWMASYPAGEFSATLASGTAAGVGTDVSGAVKDHVGNVYVNDEAEPPNYSTLPSFWAAEVADVNG